MSFRNTAPRPARLTLSRGAPVFASNERTMSMSATHNVSPRMASPFGALSVTPPWPPSMNLRFSTAPSGRTRLMNPRSEEHTSELQSQSNLVCRLLLEKKKKKKKEYQLYEDKT